MNRCIGCNAIVPSGRYVYSHICACGASVFYNDEDNKIILPLSITKWRDYGGSPPPIEDLIGESSHSSPLKRRFLLELERLGYTWRKSSYSETSNAIEEAERIMKERRNKQP